MQCSTLGDVQYSGGYHEYTGGCSVHGGLSLVHWGDTKKMHVGVIMSTPGGYHEYTGGFWYK